MNRFRLTYAGAAVALILATATSSDGMGRAKKGEVWEAMRNEMVETQMAQRDVRSPRVLEVMRKVERHLFVPSEYADHAYGDHPLPIGEGQTISQPYIVAKMTELADLKKGDRVLEVGTGSGYQAAVLATLGAEVYSIEILGALSKLAETNLQRAGIKGVNLKVGDGYLGWPEAAPFAAIVVTAAPEQVPAPLLEQLKVGGRLVIPVGTSGPLGDQVLKVLTKTTNGINEQRVFPVSFVPMTGEARRSVSRP